MIVISLNNQHNYVNSMKTDYNDKSPRNVNFIASFVTNRKRDNEASWSPPEIMCFEPWISNEGGKK